MFTDARGCHWKQFSDFFYCWRLPRNHYFISLPDLDPEVDYVSDIVELLGDSDDEEWMYRTLCGRLHDKLQNCKFFTAQLLLPHIYCLIVEFCDCIGKFISKNVYLF
jgi:hypothetical protein